jgi:hypothetical protein
MGYNDAFKRRVGYKGNTRAERNLALKQRTFDHYFENALNRELVIIDGVEQYAIFQDQNQNNNKDLSDDKYMVVQKDTNAHVGSYVEWRGQIGMVFTDEEKTIPTHKQFKTKISNHSVKWMLDNGEVSGNGKGYPAYIQNQTLYTLGISTSGNHSWIVNGKMMLYLQDNPETRTLTIGKRIMFGGMAMKVFFRDYLSRQGLIHFLLEQDFVNPERDNVEEEIADFYPIIKEEDVQDPIGTAKEIAIDGLTNAKIGSLVKYEAKVFSNGVEIQEGITDWMVGDTDQVATIVEQTPEYITLRIANEFQKVGSTITIFGKTADGTVGSKAVDIISPY